MDIGQNCELCERKVAKLTKHHLIPRTRHKNKKNKKNFDRQEIHARVLWICRACHSNIHSCISIKELEYDYNTREKLLAHPLVKKFTIWVKSQPPGAKIRVRTSRQRKD